MIDKLANQIAQWNRRELKLTETESKVIEFGLGVFLDVCVKFLILFMISVLIGKEVEFALCLLSFCGLDVGQAEFIAQQEGHAYWL